MRSRETGFADETDLITATAPYPPTEPEYWLDTYPVMMESLAATGCDGEHSTQEVALDLAILVSYYCDGVVSPSDSHAVQLYVKEHVAAG